MAEEESKTPGRRAMAINGVCIVLGIVGLSLVSNRLLDMASVAGERGLSIEERKEKAQRNNEEYRKDSAASTWRVAGWFSKETADKMGSDSKIVATATHLAKESTPGLGRLGMAGAKIDAEATAEIGASRFAQAGTDLSRMRPESSPTQPSQPAPTRQNQRTPDYFGPMWSGLQPEQKFGAFVEAFWSFARQSTGSVDCPPGDPRGIKACLAQSGFRFEATYPADCKVTFTEFVPKPANVETTWDGKVVGNFARARSLTLDLHSLKQSLINNSLRLYFDTKSPASVERSVLLSSDPNHWLTIPTPPTLSDVPPSQNESDRIRAWKQARLRSGQEVLQKYGSNNHLPYFAYFDIAVEDPGNSAELRDPNNLFYRLSPPNLMQPVALFSGNSAKNAQALFVDALKSVIAKCQ